MEKVKVWVFFSIAFAEESIFRLYKKLSRRANFCCTFSIKRKRRIQSNSVNPGRQFKLRIILIKGRPQAQNDLLSQILMKRLLLTIGIYDFVNKPFMAIDDGKKLFGLLIQTVDSFLHYSQHLSIYHTLDRFFSKKKSYELKNCGLPNRSCFTQKINNCMRPNQTRPIPSPQIISS